MPDIEWNKTYSEFNLFKTCAIPTSDEGYLIVGTTYSPSNSRFCIRAIKIDAIGNAVWDHIYQSDENCHGLSCSEKLNHYIINAEIEAGSISSHDGINSYAIFKPFTLVMDYNGNVLLTEQSDNAANTPKVPWKETEVGKNIHTIMDSLQTFDGGQIILGTTFAYKHDGISNVLLAKINKSGYLDWSRLIGDASFHTANSIIQAADDGFIIVGGASSSNHPGVDVYLVKTNSRGDIEWSKIYRGPKQESIGYSVVQTSDDGFAMGGYTARPNSDDCEAYILKVDANGEKLWDATYGLPDFNRCFWIHQASDGGIIIEGHQFHINKGFDVFLVKYTSPGMPTIMCPPGQSVISPTVVKILNTCRASLSLDYGYLFNFPVL